MPSLPRIITVDPTYTVARIVRGVMDLLGYSVVQVDVPQGADALDEVQRGGATMVISAWDLYSEMQGLEVALLIKQNAPGIAIVLLGDMEDPEHMNEETDGDPPFVYVRRPVDMLQFIRVMQAGMRGESIAQAATMASNSSGGAFMDSNVPAIDPNNARVTVKKMLSDLGAMAILLVARNGEVVLEEGASGYLNRDHLMKALLPTVSTTIEMSHLVGGQAQTIHFYDGEDKDVFVLSVGLHHFLCVVYNGEMGARNFGNVTRFGRKGAQDLIALIGAGAFIPPRQQQPAVVEKSISTKRKEKTTEVAVVEPAIERPVISVAEPEPVKLEPIANLDMSIFDQLGNLDLSKADDVFDMDKLAEMVNTAGQKQITLEDALSIGVLGDFGADGKS